MIIAPHRLCRCRSTRRAMFAAMSCRVRVTRQSATVLDPFRSSNWWCNSCRAGHRPSMSRSGAIVNSSRRYSIAIPAPGNRDGVSHEDGARTALGIGRAGDVGGISRGPAVCLQRRQCHLSRVLRKGRAPASISSESLLAPGQRLFTSISHSTPSANPHQTAESAETRRPPLIAPPPPPFHATASHFAPSTSSVLPTSLAASKTSSPALAQRQKRRDDACEIRTHAGEPNRCLAQ